MDARVLEKAVDQKADEIIPSDEKLAVAERRALALAAICQDSLDQTGSSAGSGPVDVAVIIDAEAAVETKGEKGVSVLSGPRVGASTLEEVICNGTVDLIGVAENGKPLDLGGKSRTVGPQTPASCPPPGRGVAPWKAALADTGSRSIMSSPGLTEDKPTPTIRSASVGITTMCQSTGKVPASTGSGPVGSD